MIIAVVCDVLGEENNGTTIAAMNLIRALRKRGHEVRVVCPDEDRRGQEDFYVVGTLNVGPFNNYVKKNGVVLAKPNKKVLEEAFAGVDAVHIMIPFLLARAAIKMALKKGIPVTAGFHCQAENITSHLFMKDNPLATRITYKTLWRVFYKKVQCIHYPTEFIRETFESYVGPTEGVVISNGVGSAFEPRAVRKSPKYEDLYVILFTGRYSKEKSHSVLIKAVKKSRYADQIQLVFAGEGPLKEELERQGRKLAHPPILKFYSREELIKVINCADLYVHPAEIEIEAISCLEAISCGKVPVISNSPRSATRFFALDERNLFKVNDSKDLADKIDYWLEHPEEKAACSLEYAGYAAQFDHEVCMDRMEEMIITNREKHRELD